LDETEERIAALGEESSRLCLLGGLLIAMMVLKPETLNCARLLHLHLLRRLLLLLLTY
jgi:hypothetical protein